MMIGIAGAQIRLAREFLSSRDNNPDYQRGLEDMAELLLGLLEENMEVLG